jgi:hypothetical protein
VEIGNSIRFQIREIRECHPAIHPFHFSYLLTSSHSPFTFSFPMQARYLRTSTLLFRSIDRSSSTQLKPQFHLQSKIYKRQYTMAQAMHGHSAACCSIPPIVSKGYEPKGKYETIGGLKTCKFFSIHPHLALHLQSHRQLLMNCMNRRYRSCERL